MERFPFARARVNLYSGICHVLEGKLSRAKKELGLGEEASLQLKMGFEAALVSYERGILLDDAGLVDLSVAKFPCLAERKSKKRRRKEKSNGKSSSGKVSSSSRSSSKVSGSTRSSSKEKGSGRASKK